MLRSKYFVVIMLCLLLSGCGRWMVIESTKQLSQPNVINSEFLPIKAEGKETITKSTDKVVEKTGFKVENIKVNGMDGISISKADVKVTVAHASFDFMKQVYGLKGSAKHPLGGDDYKIMHAWGPWDAPAFRAHYKADNKEIYQAYDIIPFYSCIYDVYRSDKNKELLADFQQAFAEDKIKPFAFNDKRTSQEIKAQMEGLIGQPYCSSYYKSNVVFYLKIENLGSEKIRLWPVEESVIIDNKNAQFRALTKDNVENVLKLWQAHLSTLPKGRDNPVIGVYLSKKAIEAKGTNGNTSYEDGMVVIGLERDLPAEKSGILEGDIITEINGIDIDVISDLKKALSSKVPGDVVKVKAKRNREEKVFDVKLISADDWPKPPKINLLSGGNVYPNVIYDGYLVFDTSAMLNNYSVGSIIKLIVPLIGTSFDASDKPIHSFDYEFDFKLLRN